MDCEKSVPGFLTNVVISIGGYVVFGIINYLTRRTLALNLSSVDYGFFYSAFSFVCLFTTFLDLGLASSATVLIAKYETLNNRARTNSIFSLIMSVKCLGGMLLCVVLIGLYPHLLRGFFGLGDGYLAFALLCVFIPLSASSGCINAALDAVKDFAAKNGLQILQYGVLLAVVFFFSGSYGAKAPAGGAILGNALALFVGYLYLAHRHGIGLRWSRANFREVFPETWKFTRWVAISAAGLSLMSVMDTLMLTYLKNLESVAVYNIALPIFQMLQVLMIVPVVLMPTATKLWHTGQLKQMRRFVEILVEATLWVSGGILIVLAGMSKELITVLFCAEYANASGALFFLGVALPFLIIGQFCLNTLNAMECPSLAALIVIGGVIINGIANYLLIPYLNVDGAALATALTYFTITVASWIILRYKLPVHLAKFKLLILVLAACGGCFFMLKYANVSLGYKVLLTAGVLCGYALLTSPTAFVCFKRYLDISKELR